MRESGMNNFLGKMDSEDNREYAGRRAKEAAERLRAQRRGEAYFPSDRTTRFRDDKHYEPMFHEDEIEELKREAEKIAALKRLASRSGSDIRNFARNKRYADLTVDEIDSLPYADRISRDEIDVFDFDNDMHEQSKLEAEVAWNKLKIVVERLDGKKIGLLARVRFHGITADEFDGTFDGLEMVNRLQAEAYFEKVGDSRSLDLLLEYDKLFDEYRISIRELDNNSARAEKLNAQHKEREENGLIEPREKDGDTIYVLDVIQDAFRDYDIPNEDLREIQHSLVARALMNSRNDLFYAINDAENALELDIAIASGDEYDFDVDVLNKLTAIKNKIIEQLNRGGARRNRKVINFRRTRFPRRNKR